MKHTYTHIYLLTSYLYTYWPGSQNALLIAMGNDKTHLMVSIIDGYIDLSLDYGLGTSKISKPRNRQRVNDGVEHKLILNIFRRYATVYIDSKRNKGKWYIGEYTCIYIYI